MCITKSTTNQRPLLLVKFLFYSSPTFIGQLDLYHGPAGLNGLAQCLLKASKDSYKVNVCVEPNAYNIVALLGSPGFHPGAEETGLNNRNTIFRARW
jgi:hypothetical protein